MMINLSGDQCRDVDTGPAPCEICGGTDEEGCNFSMHEEHENEAAQ